MKVPGIFRGLNVALGRELKPEVHRARLKYQTREIKRVRFCRARTERGVRSDLRHLLIDHAGGPLGEAGLLSNYH